MRKRKGCDVAWIFPVDEPDAADFNRSSVLIGCVRLYPLGIHLHMSSALAPSDQLCNSFAATAIRFQVTY